MTKRPPIVRPAGSAIAVALALASTPLLAQQAQTAPDLAPQVNAQVTPAPTTDPVLITPVLPSSTPTTTTAPPVIAPTTAPSPTMRSNPVVQEVPETAPVEEAAATPTAAPAATPRTTTPRAAAPTVATQPDPVVETTVADPEIEPVTEAKDPVPAFEEPIANGAPSIEATDEADTGSNGLGWLFGALGVIGLALLALLLFRRRGNPSAPERIKPYKPAAAAAPVPPVAPRETAPAGGFVNSQVRREEPAPVTTIERKPMQEPVAREGLATAGAAVALPRRKPETVAERTALIDRLAAAKPDRANPFTSPKARRRRARMIVQSLDREFKNGSRIDLSQYPANWPHLARRTDTVVA